MTHLLRQKEAGVKPVPKTPAAPKTKTEEDQFWNTPAASARTLQFTGDSLMDEVVDLADVSVTSPMANRTSAPLDDLEQPQEEEEYTIVPQKPTASFSPSQQPVQQHIIESEPSPVQNPPVYTAAVSVEMERIAVSVWASYIDIANRTDRPRFGLQWGIPLCQGVHLIHRGMGSRSLHELKKHCLFILVLSQSAYRITAPTCNTLHL